MSAATQTGALLMVHLGSGAYNWSLVDSGKQKILTHIAEIDARGDPVRLLCKSAKLVSVLPDSSMYEPPQNATCPRCLARFKRESKP